MPIIQLLPPLVANQIAAGEVVERPASVVKELLENSLDAGAKRVEIHLKKAGKQSIRVTDDGCGIAGAQLPLALSRHATSKINQLADLAHIASLGFRGEALASIASVSKLRMVSNDGEQGWQITIEGDKSSAVTAAAHPRGTTIEARELFFNTPVRRKFLRTDKTEYLKIDDTIKRIALSHPAVAFSFTHNDQLVFQLPAATTINDEQKRIARICGQPFLDKSEYIDNVAEGLQIRGWLNYADGGRAHSNVQYVFLNGRMVRDKLINHAIKSALMSVIAQGRYGAYVLYLRCDPATVDVNVHPTKHEVRFHQPRLLHDFMVSSLQRQINVAVIDEPVIERAYPSLMNIAEKPMAYQAQPLSPLKVAASSNFSREPIPSVLAIKALPKIPVEANYVAYLKCRYLLLEQANDLVVIDAHCLWQSWLQEQATLPSTPLAQPIDCEINEEQQAILTQEIAQLHRLGFAGQQKKRWRLMAIPTLGQSWTWPQALLPLLASRNLVENFAALISRHDSEGQQTLALWREQEMGVIKRVSLAQ